MYIYVKGRRFTELGTEISGAPTVPHSQIRLILQTPAVEIPQPLGSTPPCPVPAQPFCIRYCHGSYPRLTVLIDHRGTLKHLLHMYSYYYNA